jgi:hypothetical protein
MASELLFDVKDRVGRLLGVTSLDAATLAALETISVANFPATYDVADRVGRLLGHVTVDNPTDVSAIATSVKQDVQHADLVTRHADLATLALLASALDAQHTVHPLGVGLLGWDGTDYRRVNVSTSGLLQVRGAAGIADTQANPTSTMQASSFALGYNGATWDRWRNNGSVSLLASAARTATVAGVDQNNHNWRGILVCVDVTAASGTGGLTVKVESKHAQSGKYTTIYQDTAAITATGTYAFEIHPEAATTTADAAHAGEQSVRGASRRLLSRTFKVTVTHGDSSSYTYSAEYTGLL